MRSVGEGLAQSRTPPGPGGDYSPGRERPTSPGPASRSQVAQDRRLAENRRCAQPAHGGGGMTIIRAAFVAALALGLLIAPLTADAQSEKIGRIGYLGPSPSSGGLLQAFREGLLELGYIEGKNIAIEYRYTALAGDIDERLPLLAAELVRLKPDVLVVSITVAALATRNATTTIPIVMVNVDDPVGSGLIASLARPGGNVTGLSRLTPELIGKNLELLKEAVPRAVRVAVLSNPTNPLHPELVRNAKLAAGSLGVQLKIVEAGAPMELERAFSTMAGERVSALLALGDGMFYV